MACPIILFNQLTGADTGGYWDYLGFYGTGTTDFSGPGNMEGGNSNSLSAQYTNYDVEIDFDGFAIGFYKFRYVKGTGDCAADTELIIEVIDRVYAGEDGTVDTCTTTDNNINLFAQLTALPGETIDVNGTWTLTEGTTGVTIVNPNSAESAYVDTTPLGAGSYYFLYTVTPSASEGFPPTTGNSCSNCGVRTSKVTIDIFEAGNTGTAINVSVCN